MNIETIRNVEGIDQALMAMRNPMNSWEKGDSYFEDQYLQDFHVGDNDKELSLKLQNAACFQSHPSICGSHHL